MNPVAWDMTLVCGVIIIVQMYWTALIINPAAWDMVAVMILIIITSISVCILVHVISKLLASQVLEDLGVAVAKLQPVRIALGRLDPIQRTEEFIQWKYSMEDLQHMVEEVEVGYDRCGLDFLKRLGFSQKAGQMIHKANNLLRQGDNFLHQQIHLQGTMSGYTKKVVDFIKARSSDSAGLLGIWGMGGVGKSSLLNLVYDSRSQYDTGSMKVMFVRAGIGCTVGQVQEAIATSMEIPLRRNETSQAESIRGHLNGKSFVLLLDDLWGYLDLKAVGIPLATWDSSRPPSGRLSRANSHKIVLTTRRQDMCIQMGCRDNIIKMECFDQEDASRLYHNGWPEVIDRVDAVSKLLHEILPEQKTSNNSSRRRKRSRQRARRDFHTVRDAHTEQHPQDLLPGMAGHYRKVQCFIEAEDAQSLLLGVWGMRGVGKTTLLRLVRDSYTRNACFDHVMFVGAGTGCVVTNVQHAIAINLGLDLTKMSPLDRATKIFNHLQHKTFLLLLDDIREPFNWLAIGLPNSSHTHQKIILATRTWAACDLMGCRSSDAIEMQCLGDDDGWKLFRNKAGLELVDDHPQVYHVAKQMVSLCGGLPLALCALGRAMSNKKDPREWRSAYSQLSAMSLVPSEIDEKVCTSVLDPIYGWREDTILTNEQVEGNTTSVYRQKQAALPPPEAESSVNQIVTSPPTMGDSSNSHWQ